ncbi:MAG TPA: VOC family protein [Streptosporangiaceae bacterium]|nr:VOC family protein [Streptosporangiaceae bacterium]
MLRGGASSSPSPGPSRSGPLPISGSTAGTEPRLTLTPTSGPTVFATFEAETGYFGSRAQQAMLNFRVRDLDAMIAQLRAKGADVAEDTQEMDGAGRFGWVTDPEGNRVELWQPA